MPTYLVLAAAIVAEVVATSALKPSHGMTRIWPSALAVLGDALAFYLFSLTLRTMPIAPPTPSGRAWGLS